MTDEEIAARVKAIIASDLGIDLRMVTPDATIEDDLGADSLDAVEIMTTAEDEFDCEIPDGEVEKVRTVQDAIDLIRAAVGRKKVGGASGS